MAYTGSGRPHAGSSYLARGAMIPGQGGDARFGPSHAESITFPFVSQSGRELGITLSAQPIFNLVRFSAAGRRINRIVRHAGGASALSVLGRRTLEPADLKRIDVLTLRHGLELLRLAQDESGVAPAFWRTAATSAGRFALLYAGLRHDADSGALLVELVGGLESVPIDALVEALSHLEAQRRGVILHVAPDPALLRRLLPVAPACLAIDFAGVEHEGAKAWDAAASLIGLARSVSPMVLLLNLPPERGEAAAAAGATHAVFAHMDRLTA